MCYSPDSRLCHRSKLRPLKQQVLSCQFPIAYAVRHQQKVIASRHEFDTYPLSSTSSPGPLSVVRDFLSLLHSFIRLHGDDFYKSHKESINFFSKDVERDIFSEKTC